MCGPREHDSARYDCYVLPKPDAGASKSVVVATAAVGLQGKEGDLFRKVLPHSIALASLVAVIVFLLSKFGASWIPH